MFARRTVPSLAVLVATSFSSIYQPIRSLSRVRLRSGVRLLLTRRQRPRPPLRVLWLVSLERRGFSVWRLLLVGRFLNPLMITDASIICWRRPTSITQPRLVYRPSLLSAVMLTRGVMVLPLCRPLITLMVANYRREQLVRMLPLLPRLLSQYLSDAFFLRAPS